MKNVFFVTSALCSPGRSSFTTEERTLQTIETINSVNKYCPGSKIYLVDASPEKPSKELFEPFALMGIDIVYTGSDAYVNNYSKSGAISIAESYSIRLFLDWFRPKVSCGRIYKLSGRYQLTERFTPHTVEDGSFTFAESLDSWLPKETQKAFGVSKLYRTRLWSFDPILIDTLTKELQNVSNDCVYFNMDIEHSIYKHLHKYKVVEMPVVGVRGYTGLSKELIDE